MLFNSYIFIFLFLPIVLGAYLVLEKQHRWKLAFGWLAFASLVFYGWWKIEYLLLLIGSIVVNATLGKALLGHSLAERCRKLVLAFGIALNLGVLCYTPFTSQPENPLD